MPKIHFGYKTTMPVGNLPTGMVPSTINLIFHKLEAGTLFLFIPAYGVACPCRHSVVLLALQIT